MRFSTLSLAIERKDFKPDSNIKNLGVILSMFIRFANDKSSNGGAGWTWNVVQLADKHKVELKGLHGFDETVERIRDSGEDGGEDEENMGLGKYASVDGPGAPWKDVVRIRHCQ